ncbi:MAG: hypothetical protein GY805_03105 [Chloroflexi bacterium]|nr:hypothetical protein [Chloroflexota bacterium]
MKKFKMIAVVIFLFLLLLVGVNQNYSNLSVISAMPDTPDTPDTAGDVTNVILPLGIGYQPGTAVATASGEWYIGSLDMIIIGQGDQVLDQLLVGPGAGVTNLTICPGTASHVLAATQYGNEIILLQNRQIVTRTSTVPDVIMPTALAATAAYGYVAGINGIVGVYNLPDLTLETTIALSGDTSSADAVVIGNRVFFSHSEGIAVIEGLSLTTEFSVSSLPSRLQKSASGDLFVLDAVDNSLTVINPNTLTTVATVGVGQGPADVVDTGTAVYVAHTADNAVTVIEDMHTPITSTVSVGTSPVALATQNQLVYVANRDSDSVSIISGGTMSETVAVGAYPTFLLPVSDDVLTINQGSNNSSLVSGTTVSSVIPAAIYPKYMLGNGDLLFIAGIGSHTVTIFDTLTLTVTQEFPLNAEPVGITKIDQSVYVVTQGDAPTIYTFNAQTGALVTTTPLPAFPTITPLQVAGEYILGYDTNNPMNGAVLWLGNNAQTALTGQAEYAAAHGSNLYLSIGNDVFYFSDGVKQGKVTLVNAPKNLTANTNGGYALTWNNDLVALNGTTVINTVPSPSLARLEASKNYLMGQNSANQIITIDPNTLTTLITASLPVTATLTNVIADSNSDVIIVTSAEGIAYKVEHPATVSAVSAGNYPWAAVFTTRFDAIADLMGNNLILVERKATHTLNLPIILTP